MLRNILVDIIRSGQPRPHADSVTEALVTFTMKHKQKAYNHSPEPAWEPMYTGGKDGVYMKQTQAKVRKFVECWFDVLPEGHPDINWASSQITTLRMESPGVWRVVVLTPYTG